MGVSLNGTIVSPRAVTFNGNEVKVLQYNGTEVWRQEGGIKMYYGYVVDDALLSYSSITAEHLAQPTMTAAEPTTLGKTSLGMNPAGCRIVVAVPAETGYVVTKDNGIGGKVAWDESVLGANGVTVMIDGVDYNVYGEFATIDGETFIYVD